MLPGMELMNCPNLAVPKEVMQHVVRVESSNNPYAIGVVGGRLARQPKNLPEALATVRMLESRGYNFSLGLAQVNRYNLGKYGIDSYEKAFEVCPNLQTGSRILAECHGRSGGDWGKSFSCYYSGNFVTGYRHGYVSKIFASMRDNSVDDSSHRTDAIQVVGKGSRRAVEVTRFPVYTAQQAAPQRTQATLPLQASGQVVQARLFQPGHAGPPAVAKASGQDASGAAEAVAQSPQQALPPSVVDALTRDNQPAADEAFVF